MPKKPSRINDLAGLCRKAAVRRFLCLTPHLARHLDDAGKLAARQVMADLPSLAASLCAGVARESLGGPCS
jgi:hypothetical protein